MIMRRKSTPARPSLLGTMARTAVVVGTANAVTNKMNGSKSSSQRSDPVPHAVSDIPTGITPEKMELLKGLADLKAQGILSDEEFAAEKAKILT